MQNKTAYLIGGPADLQKWAITNHFLPILSVDALERLDPGRFFIDGSRIRVIRHEYYLKDTPFDTDWGTIGIYVYTGSRRVSGDAMEKTDNN